MVDKISSLDDGYNTGDLSVFPAAIDSYDELYEAKNNAETVLTQTMSFNGSFIVVEDTTAFPDKGLLRIDDELLYYAEKTSTVFKTLKRGYAGSQQQYHSAGALVKASVMAEHHNACKDAIYNIEHYVGTRDNPEEGTFNYQLKEFERKWLTPKASFRAWPRSGQSPLRVCFQNFSNRDAVRFLWDFGDGSVSTETSPTHTYLTEGNYTVQLRLVTSLNGSGGTTKKNYIEVRNDKGIGFMYVTPELGTTATTFTFVDQTDGDIIQRHWAFGDGERYTENDPDVHTVTHQYASSGTYDPTLMVIFADQTYKRVTLPDAIVVA